MKKIEAINLNKLKTIEWIVTSAASRQKPLEVILYFSIALQDFEKLKAFFKEASDLTLEEKDLSVRGWNWGKANFIGNALHFDVEGQVTSQ